MSVDFSIRLQKRKVFVQRQSSIPKWCGNKWSVPQSMCTRSLIYTNSNDTRPEIFGFNQICCVVELVQSKSKYNFLMVLCEDCQSQTLFAVHVLEILTTLIDQSQFNYVQKVKQLQTTHFFHTKNCDVGNCFTIIQLCTEALWQLWMKSEYPTHSHN